MNRIQMIKTVLVTFAMLVFVAWGCGQGPSFESPVEEAAESGENRHEQGERCVSHDLSVRICFICDPGLRDSGRLWCAGHDRYEDRCFMCHPELQDSERLWCDEHNLYEDECFLCHPELRDVARPGPATGSDELECKEHKVLEKECGICHPELAATLEPGSGVKIRFESSRSAARAGIVTARPVVTGGDSDVAFLIRVTWDQNHFARVTPLASGVLRQVIADVGRSVSSGDHLATLTSPEIAQAKGEYLSARAEEEFKLSVLMREKDLVALKVSAQLELDQAHTEYEVARNITTVARQQLLNFGLIEKAILHLEQTGSTSSELAIYAPLSGTIVDRDAVPGEAVESGHALFKIANLSSMWLELSIPEHEVSLVSVGQSVVASFDAQPGLQATGRVTWIGSSIDEQSRMVEGRAVVTNPDRLLRHGMFGHARIRTERTFQGIYVPADAVQQIDDDEFVFVRLAEDLFELRRVILGNAVGAKVEIAAGLDQEDEIVVTHSFIVKSEFLKSRLGAGCVDD